MKFLCYSTKSNAIKQWVMEQCAKHWTVNYKNCLQSSPCNHVKNTFKYNEWRGCIKTLFLTKSPLLQISVTGVIFIFLVFWHIPFSLQEVKPLNTLRLQHLNHSSLYNILPKRSQCQSGQFKMLQAKRNTDNSNAQQQPKPQMRKTDPNATQKYPKNIHQHIKTTTGAFTTTHLLAERPQSKCSHLQGLHAERNADDGYHHQQTSYEILHCRENTSKQ